MKNIILKLLVYISMVVAVFCVCCFDSVNAIPFYIGYVISIAYLTLFAYANGYVGGRHEK